MARGAGSLWVSDYAANSPPARWARATLDLALRYDSDQPTIYWAVVENFDSSVPNPPPGPPGDLYMTHPPADSNLWARWGSVPNTGTLADIGAVLEAIRGEGQFAYWYYAWNFSVYLDDAPFTHIVLDVSGGAPPRLALSAPRPNPARAGSTIDFALPSPGTARLEIYDAAGRRVNTLVNGALSAGTHAATWNGTDERGSAVQAGVYFARLAVGGDVLVRRLVLLP